MDISAFMGVLAGILTSIAFVPQLIRVIKTKSTKDISLTMFIIFTFGVFCWLMYGIMIRETPIIAANSFVFVLSSIILAYKIKYK